MDAFPAVSILRQNEWSARPDDAGQRREGLLGLRQGGFEVASVPNQLFILADLKLNKCKTIKITTKLCFKESGKQRSFIKGFVMRDGDMDRRSFASGFDRKVMLWASQQFVELSWQWTVGDNFFSAVLKST
jgi:hypothetical protein